MKHNINIPGWNGGEILDIIGRYAENIPENGNILELGALFGRSTYTLGHNKKPSVKLYTIDLWPHIDLNMHNMQWIHDRDTGVEEAALLHRSIVKHDTEYYLSGQVFHQLWHAYTAGIENKIDIRGNTITPTKDFPMFNFIFHDASHDYKGVYNDLVHWYPKLLPDGVIIVDDYEPGQFPGVVQAVDQFVKENNMIKEVITVRNVLLRNKI